MKDLSRAKWRRALVKTVSTVEFAHLIGKEIWVKIGRPQEMTVRRLRDNPKHTEEDVCFVTNLKSWHRERRSLLVISQGAVELLNRNHWDWSDQVQYIPYRVWRDYLWGGCPQRWRRAGLPKGIGAPRGKEERISL